MTRKIDKDAGRFRDILKGRIKGDEFKKYVVNQPWTFQKGQDRFVLPVPRINMPRFTYGRQVGGVGSGPGDLGDTAGQDSGEHAHELELSLEDVTKLLCEELELPRLENKGKRNLTSLSNRYKSISRTGPGSLRHFRRSFKEGLKRAIGEGVYVPGMPVPSEPKDFRYRYPKLTCIPDPSAVVFYLRDVSGSIDDELKEIIKTECFWCDAYLRTHYKHIESRYVAHDVRAWIESDRERFWSLTSGGGTMISSSLKLCDTVINDEFPPELWNIYLFQFSDGENFSGDNGVCVRWLKDLLPKINQYAYGEVGVSKSANYGEEILTHFGEEKKVCFSRIRNKDDIIGSLRDFLGKGN